MRQCAICGKGSILRASRNKLRGKFNPTPLKRKYPNLQSLRLDGKKVMACTSCIKAHAKKMAA